MKHYFLIYILLASSAPSLYGMLPSLPAEFDPYPRRDTSPPTPLAITVTYPAPEETQEQPAQQGSKHRKTCAICLELLYNKAESVIRLPCSRKQAFHYVCIARAHAHMNNARTCPLCRAEMLETITGPDSVQILAEQLEQEKTDRSHLESIAFFKDRHIEDLLLKIERLNHQNSSLLEEITQFQNGGAPEYSAAQHPPKRSKKRNRKRRRYWHAANASQNANQAQDGHPE